MLADSRHHMGGGIQIINIFQDLINRLGKMLHLSRKIHCTESHLFCKDPVFLCKHINLEGKAVHLPEHRAILGPQIAGLLHPVRYSSSRRNIFLDWGRISWVSSSKIIARSRKLSFLL